MKDIKELYAIMENCDDELLFYNEEFDDSITCLNCNKKCVYAAFARIEEIKRTLDPDKPSSIKMYLCIAHCCINYEQIKRGKYDN